MGRKTNTPRQCAFGLSYMLAGALFGLAFAWIDGEEPIFVPVIYGTVIGGAMIAFARGALFPRLSAWLRRQAAPVYILGTMAVWTVLAMAGYAVVGLGFQMYERANGSIMDHQGMAGDWIVLRADVLVFAIAASGLLGLMARVRDLIGTQVFLSLLLGRYHRPTREERVFLLVDVVGWTGTAERLGEIAATDYLARVLYTIGAPVRHNRGTIDRYVGDQAIISWKIVCGDDHARRQTDRAITCAFDILERLDRTAPDFLRRFGEAPRVRAVLHAGPVVVAELGDAKHEIAFIGDTINTAARLEALAKSLKEPVLASDAVLGLAPLPDGVVAKSLGSHSLRGRAEVIGVHGLHRVAGLRAAAGDPAQPAPAGGPATALGATGYPAP